MHEQSSGQRMYELEYPAPAICDQETAAGAEGARAQDKGPTLVVALHGYADAGQAVEASADHLKAALENRVIASFNTDELIDYRSRRPATTLAEDRPVEIESLDLDMRVLRDSAGKSFLLLSGPEPDLRWQAFTKAVTDLAEKFHVQDTLVVYAAPTPSPHTRPLVISAHGNSPRLVERMFRFDSTMIVPGSAQLFVERALAKKGRNVAGYTAHVPHYLAASSYPEATYGLLDSVANTAGLKLPLGALEADIERFNQQVSHQLEDSGEIVEVVRQLEQQYDAFLERYREEHPTAVAPGERPLPSAEELSQEFERFLNAVEEEGAWRDQILHEDIDDWEESVGQDQLPPARQQDPEAEHGPEGEGGSTSQPPAPGQP